MNYFNIIDIIRCFEDFVSHSDRNSRTPDISLHFHSSKKLSRNVRGNIFHGKTYTFQK